MTHLGVQGCSRALQDTGHHVTVLHRRLLLRELTLWHYCTKHKIHKVYSSSRGICQVILTEVPERGQERRRHQDSAPHKCIKPAQEDIVV